jgi:hypothetical protein
MNAEEIQNKLNELAFERTTPFCYSCYQYCPDGRCNTCKSDDLMRHLKGVGVEFGTDWVIKSILAEELSEVDFEESFEQMMDDLYGEEIHIGFIKVSVSSAIKKLDPIAWNIAKSEYLDFLIEDESVIEIAGRHYWKSELETLLE